MRSVPAVDIGGAEKKLRQAEFFLSYLDRASKDIASQYARAPGGLNVEPLEYYFSACLSAAQSVFYVLAQSGDGAFKAKEHEWRVNLPDDLARARFNRMVRFRDDDVHLATTGATALQKYIEEDQHARDPYMHQHIFQNAALFGRAAVAEETNPDGTKVRGTILRGTVGLYLDLNGQRVEATTACREFIDQLRSLLAAVSA